MPIAEILRSLSTELAPQRLGALVYDTKARAVQKPGLDGFSYRSIVDTSSSHYTDNLGKVSVALATGSRMILSELLDVSWQREDGLVISRVVAAADVSGNNRPPLDVSESEDGGEMFRHYRPSQPRAQDLLRDFLSDLMTVSAMADEFWGSMRSVG